MKGMWLQPQTFSQSEHIPSFVWMGKSMIMLQSRATHHQRFEWSVTILLEKTLEPTATIVLKAVYMVLTHYWYLLTDSKWPKTKFLAAT